MQRRPEPIRSTLDLLMGPEVEESPAVPPEPVGVPDTPPLSSRSTAEPEDYAPSTLDLLMGPAPAAPLDPTAPPDIVVPTAAEPRPVPFQPPPVPIAPEIDNTADLVMATAGPDPSIEVEEPEAPEWADLWAQATDLGSYIGPDSLLQQIVRAPARALSAMGRNLGMVGGPLPIMGATSMAEKVGPADLIAGPAKLLAGTKEAVEGGVESLAGLTPEDVTEIPAQKIGEAGQRLADAAPGVAQVLADFAQMSEEERGEVAYNLANTLGRYQTGFWLDAIQDPEQHLNDEGVLGVLDILDVALLGAGSSVLGASKLGMVLRAHRAAKASDGAMTTAQAVSRMKHVRKSPPLEGPAAIETPVDEVAEAVQSGMLTAEETDDATAGLMEARRALDDAGSAIDRALESRAATAPAEASTDLADAAERTAARKQEAVAELAEPETPVNRPESTPQEKPAEVRPAPEKQSSAQPRDVEARSEAVYDNDGSVVKQDVIPGAPKRSVPDKPIAGPAEEMRTGLFAPADDGARQATLPDPDREKAAARAAQREASNRAWESRVAAADKARETPLRKGDTYKLIRSTQSPRLVEAGLQTADGKLTDAGHRALEWNLSHSLSEDGVQGAEAGYDLLYATESAFKVAADMIENTGEADYLRELSRIQQAIYTGGEIPRFSPSMLEGVGRLGLMEDPRFKKFLMPKSDPKYRADGSDWYTEFEDHFLPTIDDDSRMEAAKRYLDDLAEGRSFNKEAERIAVPEIQRSAEHLGLALSADEALQLYDTFRNPTASLDKITKQAAGAKSGARTKFGQIIDRARTRAVVEPANPEELFWAGFGIVPGSGKGRYEDALYLLQSGLEFVADRPKLGAPLRGAGNIFLKGRFSDAPSIETGAQLIRFAADPTYGLPAGYQDIRTALREGIFRGDALSRELLLKAGKYTEDDQQILTDLLTGGLTGEKSVDELGAFAVPENMVFAQELQDVFIDLGREAVGLGLLQRDKFFENFGMYLPRMYRRHEYVRLAKRDFGIDSAEAMRLWDSGNDQTRLGQELRATTRQRGRRVRMNYDRFKRRRDRYYLEWQPKGGGRTVRDRGLSMDEVQAEIDRIESLYERRPRRGDDWKQDRARLNELRRILRGETVDEKAGVRAKGFKTAEARREFIDRNGIEFDDIVEMSDPLTEEAMEAAGIIREAPYLVYRGVQDLSYDIEVARFFRSVADNSDWALPARKGEAAPSGFRRLAGGNPNRKANPLGDLANHWVRNDIADDIDYMIQMRFNARRTSDAFTRLFKWSKVIPNPSTHARNIMSNMILMDVVGGMPPHLIPIYMLESAVAATRWNVTKGGSAPDWFMGALREGLLDSTFATQELQMMSDAWAAGARTIDPMAATAQYLTALDHTLAGARRVGRAAQSAIDSISNIYQLEEMVGKAALYRWGLQQGMDSKAAARLARKALFDYADVPPVVQVARSTPIGFPFITFQYKAIPRIIESALDNPMRIGKYIAATEAINATAEKRWDFDWDKERGLMPTYQRHQLLLPLSDEPRGVDTNFIVPWGLIQETFKDPTAPGQMLGGWVWAMISALNNRDPFSQQPIYQDTDSTAEKTYKSAAYLYRYLLPGFVPSLDVMAHRAGVGEGVNTPGGAQYERVQDYLMESEDILGNRKQPELSRLLFDIGLGLRIRDLDPEAAKVYEQLRARSDVRRLESQARSTARRLERKEITPEQAQAELDRLRASIDEIGAQMEALTGGEYGEEGSPHYNDPGALETLRRAYRKYLTTLPDPIR